MGSGISVTGAATTIYGYFESIPIATLIGVIVAVLGFLINVYFGWRKDRREQLKFELERKQILNSVFKCKYNNENGGNENAK